MTQENLERSIARCLQHNIQFEAEDEKSLKVLQIHLTQFDIWSAAVSILTLWSSSKIITSVLKETEFEKLRLIEKIANEIGYTIAQKYFKLKIATNRHLSPFHCFRFSGISSVPELNLEFGHRNLRWIDYASISKVKFICTYASETNTSIHNYCQVSNTLLSSDGDRLLEVEASKILHYLMNIYHQKLVPDLQRQYLWEPWMALYINKV